MPPRTRRSLSVVGDGEQDARGLAEKVRETLEKLEIRPEDAALAALTVEYARTIDQAKVIAARAAKVPYDPDTAEELANLRKRVSAQVTMADLGPKLLAALDALGATPKARASAGKPSPAGARSKLAALRDGSA